MSDRGWTSVCLCGCSCMFIGLYSLIQEHLCNPQLIWHNLISNDILQHHTLSLLTLSLAYSSLLPSTSVCHVCRQIRDVLFEYAHQSQHNPHSKQYYQCLDTTSAQIKRLGCLSFIVFTLVRVIQFFSSHTPSSSRISLNCVLRPQRRQPGFWMQP